MAALQFLGKYREGGLFLIRVSIGLMFVVLIAPVLWSGHRGWDHFGSAVKHLDLHSHYAFWGFVGALIGAAGGLLMILGLFFRIGVLFALVVTVVHLIGVWSTNNFYSRLAPLEMSILLVALLFVGPGKFSVDKN
jgi:putative oxidoreductase